MPDTDLLRPYKVGEVASLPGSEQLYLANELQRVSQAIGTLTDVLKLLEARIEVLEP